MVKKPRLGDLIIVEWRDSFTDHGQTSLVDHDEDCLWSSVGWVMRLSKLFLTIAYGIQTTKVDAGTELDSPLSIPWTQVIKWEKVEVI